jgi:hypothetical protein
MGHKLSILKRQQDKTGWHPSSQYDIPSVQQIKVDGSGKGKSLNAIPSPFARMHLFETAFEMVFQDLINKTKLAGEAYNKIVSDCLDVFEMLYNWESHIKDGKNLEIVTWVKNTELNTLSQSNSNKHKLLGQTLDTFIKEEPAFYDFEKCLIIKCNGNVIAGSSLLTGFFTTPDDLSNFNLLKPLSQIAYFSRTIPFDQRKTEIKKYIFDFFEKNQNLRISEFTQAIRNFLEWYKNQGNVPSSDSTIELKDIIFNGVTFEIFGQNLKTAKSIGTEYFEKQIIRLSYRLNSECFCMPRVSNDDRPYDYLIPLSTSFFEQYSVEQIEQLVSINQREEGSIEVTIKVNGRTISKKYQETPIHDTDGKIIDLNNDHQFNFNIGIFPFLKIVNQTEGLDYNDFYRVMLTFDDLNYRYSNKDINLKFGKNGGIFDDGSVYKIDRVDRTIFERDKSPIGSTYFGLNTCFDFIQVQFPFLANGQPIKAMIVPKWKEKAIGNRQFDFAIDLGTTSTFIAHTDDAAHQSEPKPLEFNEKELPVALLNKPKNKRTELKWIDCFESVTNNLHLSIEIQKQELIPSIIKKNEKYEFPIRTALYQKRSIAANQKKTLQNANISFVYQKKDIANLGLLNQEFKTNLKWNIKTNIDYESAIEVFIEELFLFIRTKILLNDGDPRKSKICWLSPLSFTAASKRAYTDLWNRYSQKIIKFTGNNIYNLTESEAPFYYLFRNATINNSKSVLTLDIGGGSTDIMLFEQNKPVYGTSVHFGANVIWGNGFSSFVSEKTNGIYLSLKDQISENLRSTELKKVNEDYCSTENSFAGSDEIMNFWIANNDLTKVISNLNKGDFRFTYLLHLSALIYHNLKLIKFKEKTPPTCIIFSGNGSKYIDLIHDHSHIEKLWGYFARKIFDENISNPQVILPTENRKEATCYGGLFKPLTPSQYDVENYLGFESKDEKYLKYRDIENNKDLVFKKTISAFSEFIEWFFEMNDTKDLNFRSEFGIETKLNPLKKFITEKAEENLNIGFTKRLEQVDKDDLISDSIFYYPLVGLLYKINRLSKDDFNNLTEKTTYYFNGPDGENEFFLSQATLQTRPDSLYKIIVENESPNTGVLEVLDNPTIQKRALAAYQGFIDPACVYDIFPQPDQLIKTNLPGKVKKEANKWLVTQKIKIEFV